jgi:hypothetical protein
MTFLQYVSMLGVERHIRPSHVLLHGDVIPHGQWWQRTVSDVTNIYYVNTSMAPTHIYGHRLHRVEHRTDLLRYNVIYGD